MDAPVALPVDSVVVFAVPTVNAAVAPSADAAMFWPELVKTNSSTKLRILDAPLRVRNGKRGRRSAFEMHVRRRVARNAANEREPSLAINNELDRYF